ncbi:MAG: hypothetical protein OXJ52_08735 [Oligoflexia bacterium]|nr:hypothetical protein [Oligoflexia bacterium]
MRLFKYFFVFIFLLSCQPGDMEQDSARARRLGSPADEEREKDRGFLDRSSELRRLRNDRSKVISATLEDRYEGIPYGDYEGRDCEESESCKGICDDLVSYSKRKRCYNSPQGLVEDLENALFDLIRISDVNSEPISANLLAGIFHIDEDLLMYLVKEQMSEGDLRIFLAWVAINEDISKVFLNEDKSSDILEEAFEKLAEAQDGVTRGKRLETALNAGLIEDEDSFFYLTSAEDNSAGFEIAYDLLQSACSSKDCKMTVLCSRETQSSSRSRVFGYQSTQTCRTLARQDRRASRGGTCYVHGSVTWGFLDELIEERDIKDSDFKGKPITVEQCNNFCGNERTSAKCKRVL